MHRYMKQELFIVTVALFTRKRPTFARVPPIVSVFVLVITGASAKEQERKSANYRDEIGFEREKENFRHQTSDRDYPRHVLDISVFVHRGSVVSGSDGNANPTSTRRLVQIQRDLPRQLKLKLTRYIDLTIVLESN
ncbi:hypothetical protein KQX54_002746 [Cotesia glomerata]|uniref:Uncharacterized protein n=1 Tax=Cotesia glomerata TaxID=32391 RepID=A0AAV7HWU9_COTGL|nr:hypothetical protein KQX54_002746 [Cotesia glomerata]